MWSPAHFHKKAGSAWLIKIDVDSNIVSNECSDTGNSMYVETAWIYFLTEARFC
jgi:hypothetical protein